VAACCVLLVLPGCGRASSSGKAAAKGDGKTILPRKAADVDFRVLSRKRNRGKLLGLPDGQPPPKGKEWLEVDVTFRNPSPREMDISEFKFRLDIPPARPLTPVSKTVTVDRTSGLDSHGALATGGVVHMTVAFAVPAGSKSMTLLFISPFKRAASPL
jgi:hypothetical protein